jgi:hypothetical protein
MFSSRKKTASTIAPFPNSISLSGWESAAQLFDQTTQFNNKENSSINARTASIHQSPFNKRTTGPAGYEELLVANERLVKQN